MKWIFPAVIAAATLVVASCQSVPPPPPVSDPVAPAEVVPVMVEVNASALNVRSEPSMDGDILTQVKRGNRLALLESAENWMMIELPDGRTGWAASRFLLRDGEKPKPRRRRKGSCQPDSDFAFATAPTPTFSDSDQQGDVIVDAYVDARGNVKSTKVIKNSTGDESLAFLTEREIKTAKFIAPVRNCVVREFIYTYKRTF